MLPEGPKRNSRPGANAAGCRAQAARLLLAAAAVLLAGSASAAGARRLLQTPSLSTPVVVRWFEPANGRLNDVSVPVNGSVTFEWSGTHDLWEVPSLACPPAFRNGSGLQQLAPGSRGGSTTVRFNATGIRYFACSVGDHCEDGQLIAVRVGNAALAPSPAGRYRGGSSANYGQDGQPLANYGGSSYGEEEEDEDDDDTPGYGGSSYGTNAPSSGYGSGSSNASSGYGSGSSNANSGYGSGSSNANSGYGSGSSNANSSGYGNNPTNSGR